MIGSSMASTRTPQTTPLMRMRDGLGFGASEKKVSTSASLASWASSALAP
jgi:hypothetical protein